MKGFSSFDFIFSALLVGSTVVMTFDFVEMKRSGLVVVQGVLADEGLATRFTGPFPRLFDLGVALLGGGSLPFVPAFVFPSFDFGIISLTSSDYLLFASNLHLCFLDSNLVRGEAIFFAPDQFRDSDVTAATIILDVVQRPGQQGRHAISLGSRVHSPERKREESLEYEKE